MNNRSINIDRLEIRLRGISPQAARAAASELGRDLLHRLAVLPVNAGRSGAVRLDRIDSGALHLAAGTRATELRHAIAQKITGSIQSKLKSERNQR